MNNSNKNKNFKLKSLNITKTGKKLNFFFKRNFNLSRECKIKIDDNNSASKEITVNFDELEKKDFLGRGQFGTVIKMVHTPTNQVFAVKMIEENRMEANDKQNEGMDLKALQKIDNQCPNLIKFYGALHAESAIWILTEKMDTSLDRFYSTAFALEIGMPEQLISKIAHAVSEALFFMKQIKILHRDIKPPNILLNYTGEIKVCDLGICGFPQNSVIASFGKGCQSYMAPEKIDPSMTSGQYSIKSDIWSLGISLIEIATGSHPLNGSSELLALIRVIVLKDPPRLDETKFSVELCDLVKRCLIKWPDNRISCIELLEHDFIKNYHETPVNLEFIKKIIDEIDDDIDD